MVPDKLKDTTYVWKKVLGGCLIKIRQKIFSYLESLTKGTADKKLLQEAFEFAGSELCILPSKIRILVPIMQKGFYKMSTPIELRNGEI